MKITRISSKIPGSIILAGLVASLGCKTASNSSVKAQANQASPGRCTSTLQVLHGATYSNHDFKIEIAKDGQTAFYIATSSPNAAKIAKVSVTDFEFTCGMTLTFNERQNEFENFTIDNANGTIIGKTQTFTRNEIAAPARASSTSDMCYNIMKNMRGNTYKNGYFEMMISNDGTKSYSHVVLGNEDSPVAEVGELDVRDMHVGSCSLGVTRSNADIYRSSPGEKVVTKVTDWYAMSADGRTLTDKTNKVLKLTEAP